VEQASQLLLPEGNGDFLIQRDLGALGVILRPRKNSARIRRLSAAATRPADPAKTEVPAAEWPTGMNGRPLRGRPFLCRRCPLRRLPVR
jgi:hypothetical protein